MSKVSKPKSETATKSKPVESIDEAITESAQVNPFGVETKSGKYIVLQCKNKAHAAERLSNEYPDEEVKVILKVV